MPREQSKRPDFYEGQYLGAEDLDAAVDYGRRQHARHLLGGHTWGIASGLELTEGPSTGTGLEILVQPGFAWDGFGRPVVVLAPYRIPAELFESVAYDAVLDGGTPAGRLFAVWLRYDESPAAPTERGFEACGPGGGFSRVRETFRVVAGHQPDHDDRHDPISVAGRVVDAAAAPQAFHPQQPPVSLDDESVPHQELPADEDRARWLIPLGLLRWRPSPDAAQPGAFIERDDQDLLLSRRARRYVGVVAEGIQAADGVLRLRHRLRKPSTRWSDDLVWVEGDLRVDGKVNLADESSGAHRWQLRPAAGGLTVSESDGGGPLAPRLFIAAGGDTGIGIGTSSPAAALDVNGTVLAKAFATKVYKASGSASVMLKPDPGWYDFPDLSATITLGAGTNVLACYQIVMPGGAGDLFTRLAVDGSTGLTGGRASTGDTKYWCPSASWLGPLSAGSHTLTVQYRAPQGGSNNPGDFDWHQRVLQILVLGSG